MAPSCLRDAPVYLLPPLTGFLAFLSLALLPFFRSRRNRTNLIFGAICLLCGIINLDVALVCLIDNREMALSLDRATYVLFIFSVPLYLRFIHGFLGVKRRGLEWSAWTATMLILPFTPTSYFIRGLREYPFGRIAAAGPVYHVFAMAGGLAILYCLAILIQGLKSAEGNEERNRIKYVIAGLGSSAVLILLSYLSVSGFDLYPCGNFSFLPAAVLAYGVLKYDIIDTDAAFRKGVLYFALSLVLTAVFIAAIYLAHFLFSAPAPGPPPLISFVVALALAVFFQPLRDRLQAGVDRIFFKGKYDYQAMLKNMSGALGTLLKADEVKGCIVSSIQGALHVSPVWILVFEESGTVSATSAGESRLLGAEEAGPGHPVEKILLERKSCLGRASIRDFPPGEQDHGEGFFQRFDAALLVPMMTREELAGIIAVGEKLSGDLFVHEDLELLMTIANQGAIALANARHYGAVERMNLELESRVAERTAALEREIREKEAALDRLIRSESLAAIGQLVAGTAHELNNPLASAYSLVQTSVECLSSRPRRSEREAEIINDLEFSLGEMRRARDIIASLLDLSRQTGRMDERVDVNLVIEDALKVLHNRYKNSSLEIEKSLGESPVVRGNFGSLGQVFLNILKNAMEAAPAGRGKVSISTCVAGSSVVVKCSDNGPGIPPDIINDVFKPFFTTKGVGKGTGLGLYISHELIRRHGGTIRAGNVPGGGARIYIEIPREI